MTLNKTQIDVIAKMKLRSFEEKNYTLHEIILISEKIKDLAKTKLEKRR